MLRIQNPIKYISLLKTVCRASFRPNFLQLLLNLWLFLCWFSELTKCFYTVLSCVGLSCRRKSLKHHALSHDVHKARRKSNEPWTDSMQWFFAVLTQRKHRNFANKRSCIVTVTNFPLVTTELSSALYSSYTNVRVILALGQDVWRSFYSIYSFHRLRYYPSSPM